MRGLSSWTRLTLFIGLLFVPSPALALGPQLFSPQLFLNSPVEGLAVSGPDLFWKAGCGHGPLRAGYIRTIPAAVSTGGGNAFGGGFLGQTVFQPPNCRSTIASRNVAIAGTAIYFIDASRRLMRIGTDGEGLVAIAAAQAPAGRGYFLAPSPGWIAWTNGASVYRIRTNAIPGLTPGGAILDPEDLGGGVGDLLASGDNYVAQVGTRLHLLEPLPSPSPGFRSVPLDRSEGVTAFTVSGADVYFAAPGDYGNYVIRAIEGGGPVRDLYTPESAHDFEQVDQIAVGDGMIFWHVVNASLERGQSGQIMQMALAGGAASRGPERITDDIRLSPATRLAVIAGYLMWTSLDDRRLYRLPISPLPLPRRPPRP